MQSVFVGRGEKLNCGEDLRSRAVSMSHTSTLDCSVRWRLDCFHNWTSVLSKTSSISSFVLSIRANMPRTGGPGRSSSKNKARSSGVLCVNASPLREGMKAPAIFHRLRHVSQAAIG